MSAVGDGAEALLRAEGIQIRNLRREGEAHAISAALSTRRDRSFVTFNGVNDRLEPRLATAVGKERARHMHFAFYPRDCRRWERAVVAARRRGISTSWDFGWNEGLLKDEGFARLTAALDYVFLNELEAPLYSRRRSFDRAVDYWRGHARNAVIKLGPQGSQWVSSSIDVSAPAPRAGDRWIWG